MTLARRPDYNLQQFAPVDFTHPSVTATSTYKVFKAHRTYRVTRITYINHTGLAEDTTNTFAGDVKVGTDVVAALFATDSDLAGADNSLAASTFIVPTLNTDDAVCVLEAGEELLLVLTEGGTATLPEGRLRVEGYYVD